MGRVAVVTFLLLQVGQMLFGQHNHSAHVSPRDNQSGIIDGSKTPSLIPDSTAYRVFFRAFTADSNPDRQKAMLRAATLSDADFAVVMGVAAQFQSLRAAYIQMAEQAWQTAQSSGAPTSQATLTAAQTALGTTVQSALQNAMSVAGMKSFDALIQCSKRGITITPIPSMGGAQ